MPIKIVKFYRREEFKRHPDWLFIFGDNDARVGRGGQAKEARGEPNAIGIRTKKAPTYNPTDFYTDAEYARNIGKIFADFQPVLRALELGQVVVWPQDGIGTGIARLSELAPETLKFINGIIASLIAVCGTVE